jgi:hypothetical protein
MGQGDLRVFVWESKVYWSRAIRRHLTSDVTVASRSYETCNAGLLVEPPTVHVWDVAPKKLDGVIDCLQRWRDRSQTLHLAVLEGEAVPLRWNLMELGVAMCWTQMDEVPAVCDLIERFSRTWVPPHLSLEQQIWKNLPWPSCRSTFDP